MDVDRLAQGIDGGALGKECGVFGGLVVDTHALAYLQRSSGRRRGDPCTARALSGIASRDTVGGEQLSLSHWRNTRRPSGSISAGTHVVPTRTETGRDPAGA
jgi:hypothetical protein